MSTLERINGKVYFQVEGKMVTKSQGKWIDSNGNKFDRNKIHNLIHSKTLARQSEVNHVKSILNRHFDGAYKFN